MASEPAFGIIYGEPGVGKTTDLILSFPKALFIADKGALKPASSVVGIDVESVPAKTLNDATTKIMAAGTKHKVIVVDDFTLMMDWQVRAGTGQFWSAVYDSIFKFREAAEKRGAHVILNAHQAPVKKDDNGNLIKGTVLLPGSLADKLLGPMDFIYRASISPLRKPWGMVYNTKINPQFVAKCRHNSPDPSPGNVGELMRAAGYELEEPFPGWTEKTEALVKHLKGGKKAAELFDELRKTETEEAATWLLRDAIDRVSIQNAKAASRKASFG